jgi:membrane-bound lytic murein transglycosylase D
MLLRHTSSILCPIVLALCALQPTTAIAQSADSIPRHPVLPAGAPVRTTPPVRRESDSLTRAEVARRAVEVFGDSLVAEVVQPVLPDSAAPVVAEPTWDMDVRSYETQDRVAHYVSMFSGRAKDRISERLDRGSRYEPMIRARMKAGGLPEDMYYLALVESGFDPHAYSRAAAVGMWQFMTSTGRDMGLRIDWWVDERRDPVRSTSAAVRFIRGLRDQFGSLYLAAAAYNGGPGRVARGLARYADADRAQGEDAFFVLAEKDYLKNETREYVPQLIAAALIAKEPSRYGMELHPRPAYAYDSVRVAGSTPLAAVASACSVPISEVTELNPHLLRGMTPPRDSYVVRVPVGSAAGFDSSFAALPDDARIATRTVESRKGDTAERLARVNGIAESAVIAFNPKLLRLKSGRLAPAQSVLIPTAAVAAAAFKVPDPAIEKYPSSTKRMKVHTVKKGETIGAIARRYSTSTDRIMRLNGLRKPMIFPGQSLIVAGSGGKKGSVRSASKAGTTKKAKAAASATQKHSGASSKAGARKKSEAR